MTVWTITTTMFIVDTNISERLLVMRRAEVSALLQTSCFCENHPCVKESCTSAFLTVNGDADHFIYISLSITEMIHRDT